MLVITIQSKRKVIKLHYPTDVNSAHVFPNCIIGNGCVVGTATEIVPGSHLVDDTVVWGPQNHTRIQPNAREVKKE